MLVAVCASGILAADSAPRPTVVDRDFRADAALHDVQFVNAKNGWAVGDCGVIWNTDNGGRSWHIQTSKVACRLNAVSALDGRTAWVGGGWCQPYDGSARGCLLRTSDGGRTWEPLDATLLPEILELKMLDGRHGWAVVRPSPLYPAGIVATDDGGRSWTPRGKLPEIGAWRCGDFLSKDSGVVAGESRVIATISGRRVVARAAEMDLRGVRSLKMASPKQGWAVGDGGLLLSSNDRGKSWQEKTVAGAAAHDFRAIAVRGDHLWITGSPGNVVFTSTDGGENWTTQNTGYQAPLSALYFIDPRRGWAVGSLGTILHTADGGKSWHLQKQGAARAAVLAIFADASEVPLELFAQSCAGQGVVGVVSLVTRRDLDGAGGTIRGASYQSQHALLGAGASDVSWAWQFPVRQRGLRFSAAQTSEHWAGSIASLEARLATEIRLWRPEVVVTSQNDYRGKHPMSSLVHRAVRNAMRQAASDQSPNGQPNTTQLLPRQRVPGQLAPGQLAPGQLAPWQVSRLYTLDRSGRASVKLARNKILPRLGASVGDYVAPWNTLLDSSNRGPGAKLAFQLVESDEESSSKVLIDPADRSLAGARRKLRSAPPYRVEQLQRIAQGQQQIAQMVAAVRRRPALGVWKASVNSLVAGLEPAAASARLYQLGSRYAEFGHHAWAAKSFARLVERRPDDPVSGAACVWLLQYHASAERQYQATRSGEGAPEIRPVHDEQIEGEASRVVRPEEIFDETAPLTTLDDVRNWSDRLKRRWPMLAADPEVVFSMAAAERRFADIEKAQQRLDAFAAAAPNVALKLRARREIRLLEGRDAPANVSWVCRRVQAKPHLDGNIDELFWRQVGLEKEQPRHDRVTLQGTLGEDQTWPAESLMAYDEEYLYLAARCRKTSVGKYTTSDAPRPRDADLADFDRITWCLDVDRDVASHYQLTVDHRGWTHDAINRDATWNPTWYVAADRDDRFWTVEIAIPWSELVGSPPASGDVWSVGVQRIAPGAGFQSWTQPAAVQVQPTGFGYLRFE